MKSKSIIKTLVFALIFTDPIVQASSENVSDSIISDKDASTAITKIKSLLVSSANTLANSLEINAENNGWKHLDLSFGLENNKPTLDIMSVYGLKETKNWFIFNQSSLVNFDNRNTINFGLGARHINDNEDAIVGINAFYDYELKSKHQRTGLGVEYLTNPLQFRANTYRAKTSTILYKGINEEALDGYDLKLSYKLPTLKTSSLYVQKSKWQDSSNYKTSSDEIGYSSQLSDNLRMIISAEKTDSKKATGGISLTYSIPLGKSKSKQYSSQNTAQSIRKMIYQPIQRENRIKKKSISLGVTVSGY